MRVSDTKDMDELARKHGLNIDTVRTWDKRGAVPDAKLSEFAARYGVAVSELTQPTAGEAPPAAYRSSGQIDSDPFVKRLATAMDIVDSGLAATGLDAAKVPRSEMAAAVFKLLPWPIPWAAEPGKTEEATSMSPPRVPPEKPLRP